MSGIVKLAKALGVKLAPQDEALRVAQENAVKMLGLPPGNTPMDRARAMGMQDVGAHYTPESFGSFAIGTRPDNHAVWSTKDKSVNLAGHNIGRGEYVQGVNAVPLMARINERLPLTLKRELKLSSDFPRTITADDARKAKGAGYDYATIGTEMAVFDPSRVRSRFAAFDPARINENNLLASRLLPFALPGLLSLPMGDNE